MKLIYLISRVFLIWTFLNFLDLIQITIHILICILDTHRKRSGGSTSDDQYFRDNRTWTSTRDRHLEMTGLQSDEELNANEIFVQTESKNQIPVSNLLSD